MPLFDWIIKESFDISFESPEGSEPSKGPTAAIVPSPKRIAQRCLVKAAPRLHKHRAVFEQNAKMPELPLVSLSTATSPQM